MSDLYLKELVALRDGTPAEVREMAFPDFIQTVQKVFANLAPLRKGDAIELDLEKLVPVIASQASLAAWTLSKASNLSPEKIAALGPRDTLAVLGAVVRMNVNEEVIELGKTFAGDVAKAFGLKKTQPAQENPSPAPSTIS